jgi:hypothetical protein
MRKPIDIVLAVITLIVGAVMLVFAPEDTHSLAQMIVAGMASYILGAFRDKPGGFDEAMRVSDTYYEEMDGTE